MKRLAAVAGLLASLVLIAGAVSCGGNKGGNDSTPGGVTSQGASSGPALRLVGSDPLTLDPALVSDAVSAAYIVEIFGGLVTIDKDLKIAPDIAQSWDISADGKVYTFHLRNGVAFQNTNRAVTASDFKYSMERAANPDTASPVVDAYLGDIVGAKDMIDGKADQISGIEVVDDHTLRITIDQPKPYFLAKMATPTAFVVDRTQVEKDKRNWTRHPNGTGPYQMADWTINEKMTLQANESYHLGVPAVNSITYQLSGTSSLTMYENDEIDVSGVGVNDIDRVLDPSDPLHSEYVSADNLSTSYIGFNTQKAPFDDPKVRQAFAMAIDRDKIAQVVLKGLLPVANSILPPGLPGYNANAVGPTYDPEKAKQLLAESKYAGNLGKITLTIVGSGATSGDDTQAIVEMWKQNLGVDVQIQQTEDAVFFQDLDKGDYQMFAAGWVMDYPDPEDILDILFYSTSRQNSTRYSNPAVDSLLEQARVEQDATKRMALYQQAEQLILNDAPWIPLYNGRDHVLVKPYVKGYLLPPLVMPSLRYVSILQ